MCCPDFTLIIRNYTPNDAREITNLFYASVHSVAPDFYSLEQKEAWAPTPPNYESWQERLAIKKPFIAVKKNLNGQDTIAGFIELEDDGHIDCLYVHPEHQHQGIATALLVHLITVARERGINGLFVGASMVAKPLFEKYGFKETRINEVSLRGQVLINYSMTLQLTALI